MPLLIHPETPIDLDVIDQINRAAFPTGAEADLVARLRQESGSFLPELSLVAWIDTHPIGHILFTPVAVEGAAGVRMAGLGPMAVLPHFQKQGIGAALVYQGLEACRRAKFTAVVVLGHTHYYPRFGFVPASRYGLRCQWDVPDDVFMAQELTLGSLEGVQGLVKYHPAFDGV